MSKQSHDIVRAIDVLARTRAQEAISRFCESDDNAAYWAEQAHEALVILEQLLDDETRLEETS